MPVLGTPLAFGANATVDVSLRNFSAPEDGFVWSLGPWCEVGFDLELPEGESPAVEITFDANVFSAPPALPGQSVAAYLNGYRIGTAWVTGRGMIAFRTPPEVIQPGANLLTLDIPGAIRPSAFGQPDDRRLGVKIFTLTVRPLE